MINTTEALLDYGIDEIKPATLLKNLINKYNLDTNFLDALNLIVNSNKIELLTILELFALLWWFSCKNIFCFIQSYYYLQAKNGNIGKVLIQLKKHVNNEI